MAESTSYSKWSTEVSYMDWPIYAHVLELTGGAEQQVLENYCAIIGISTSCLQEFETLWQKVIITQNGQLK